MKLQNSYIFIPNTYSKEDTTKRKVDGGIILDFTHNFVSYFTSLFPKPRKEELDIYLFSLEYSNIIELNKETIEVKFRIYEVVETYFLDVVIVDNKREKIIRGFEFIQSVISNSNISSHYIEIITYDAISEYYCNQIYPKLNGLERSLRKLLFNIYVVNFGRAYYQTTISEDLQSKVKSVIKAKGNDERKEIETIKKFFYSMEFADIEQMLFIAHWTSAEEKAKCEFLKKHSDLSKLTDTELREAFSSFSPKSDWERLFVNKMDAGIIRSLLNEIRESRNSIAHCKFFYRKEYETCSAAITRFNKVIQSAIAITERKDFPEKNGEALRNAIASMVQVLEEYKATFTPVFESIIQLSQRCNELVAPIRENLANNASLYYDALRPAFELFQEPHESDSENKEDGDPEQTTENKDHNID